MSDWQRVRIGDIAQIPQKQPIANPQAIELLRVRLYANGVERTGKFPRTTERGRPYFARSAGELLIGRQSFHNGGIGIVKEADNGLICSNAITSLVPNSRADRDYLFYILASPEFRKEIEKQIEGTAQAEISERKILSLELNLPPLSEQKRIARILSELSKLSDSLNNRIEKISNLFACLLDEQFAPASPGKRVSLESISEFITYGLTVRPRYIATGIPMVSAGECRDGFIDFAKAKKISQSDFSKVRSKTIPTKGDLLITKTGTLGRVAVVPEGVPSFTITQNVALVRPKESDVLPKYLAYYIMSPACQREIRDKTSVLAIPDLQLGILGNFSIPVPCIDKQNSVYLRFDSIRNTIRVLQKQVDQIDQLRNTLASDLLSGRKRVSV